jgi:putative nucleotidyltransferase with HDIG domain
MNVRTHQILQRRIDQVGNLPAIPSVLNSLSAILSGNPSEGNVDRIVELISYDKCLAAQCLRTANSALFHQHARVDSLRRAVLTLGVWRVRDLVYSCSLPSVFGTAAHTMAPITFWRHALGTALVSQHLAERLAIGNSNKFYLAGLLHDIGLLVNSLLFQKEFTRILKLAESSGTPLCEVELQNIGFTHCESGRVLADIWKIPLDVADTIEFHHDPASSVLAQDMTAAVHLADLLCRLRGLGYGYYEAREFDLTRDAAWRFLQKRYPAAAGLDLARFTFELDGYAVRVQGLVDSILGAATTDS